MSKTTPPVCPVPHTGPRTWRSLDELAESPEFQAWAEREFPDGASELTDPVSRRNFMRLMSASLLLAGVGLTGCRRPVEKIQPFSRLPENYVHGVSQYFATSCPGRTSAVPLVVKSHEGRPIKIEGNPEHPLAAATRTNSSTRPALAGTDVQTQASILNLYDPDRARRFTHKGENVSREKALDALANVARQAAADGGKGLAFLLERTSSPSRQRLRQELAAHYPQARWFVHEAVDFAVHHQAATLLCGQPTRPWPHLDRARRILTLDCDFIGGEEDAHLLIGGFARSRRLSQPEDEISRLYAVESLYTLTGSSADHRLRLPASQMLPLACLVFAEVATQSGVAAVASLAQAARPLADSLKPEVQAWIKTCAADLIAHRGQTLVLAGYRQPLVVHLLAHAITLLLEGAGKTVTYLEAPATPQDGSITELTGVLRAGQVQTLVILGGNPVYTAPADLDWANTQRKAATVIRLGAYEDETAALADWHLPQAHYLESWGDARTADGTLVPVQPLIEPLFGGWTELEVLARLGGLSTWKPYDLVRETFRQAVAGAEGDADEHWKRFLHDGFLAGSAPQPRSSVTPAWDALQRGLNGVKPLPSPTKDQLEVVFARDHRMDDGRHHNNGWLQELPDPITKITWDNVISLSPQTASELGIRVVDANRNDLRTPVVRIEVEGRALEGPVWIQPGMADGVVGVTLGYGRPRPGRVGRGSGYNAYPLRTSTHPYLATGATLRPTGRTYPLSCTQNHWFMLGRPIVREANLEEYRRQPHFAATLNLEEPPVARPMYPNPLDELAKTSHHQWGMSIDLGACVGCAACSVACQSENNIPIVGKDQVNRHREMHWIRVDRYFLGPLTDPQVVHQPMLCQHCEAAPCESVCPVNATVHDHEGLNVMAYNRCVGTRYCSNNCPYKVRRFNFFDYHRRPIEQLYRSPLLSTTDGEWELKRWFKNPDRGSKPQDEWDLLRLAKNPDVTVRMRGVMEKCTFCVQRIEQAKIQQKVKAGASGKVEVPDGAFQTACEQACPAGAIVFGNLKDPHSRVVTEKANSRTYQVLEFLNVKPRVTYQARVRNPNPAMPDHHAMPWSTREFLDAGGTFEAPHPAGGGGHATEAAVGQGGGH